MDIFLLYIYQEKKMKMLNYDPSLTAKSNYKRGHPCMPADTFQMLICGPSNSGKTNTLLNMLYKFVGLRQNLPLHKKPASRQVPIHD